MPLRILVVDDNPAVRRGVRSLLATHEEYSICGEAVDGIDAIEKTKQLRPDAILMDVSMPLMDGLQATRAIRRDFPDTKIIIVSQYDTAVVTRQAVNAGAYGFVAKASLGQDLLPTIARLLDGSPVEHSDRQHNSSVPPQLPWLSGGGEMGERVREFDWSKTSVGPFESWPVSLKTAVQIVLSSRYPMFVWWGEQLCNFYNDGYIPMLGKRHPDALGRPASAVWSDVWPIVGPQTETVLREGKSTWNEELLLVMERNGFPEEAYFTFSYSPAPNDNGGTGGVFCALTEETHRVLARRRLRLLRSLAEQANQARTAEDACKIAAETLAQDSNDLPFALLYLLDREGHRATLAGTLGLDPGDAAAPHTIELSKTGNAWPLAHVAQSGESVIVSQPREKTFQLPGSPPPEEACVLPMAKAGQGSLAGFVVAGIAPMLVFDDDYKLFLSLLAGHIAAAVANAHAYEEEKQRAEALAEIDRAKTVFFSNVSHEFRTPLTLMLGPVHDLLTGRADQLPPKVSEQLEMVSRNGTRLLRLVNTLLDFSRIEAGRMQANYQPTDLATFTAELASAFHSATDRAGLRLRIACEPVAEPVYVDRDMWEKIVLNLVSNAFKFTFEGDIAVSVRRAGDSVELTVRDTGVGIPSEQMPRLFERFHRVETSRSRTHEGSGIGLALVQELVKLHGGTLGAESALGRGTTFTVSLPLGKEHLPPERIGANTSLSSAAAGATPFVDEALRWLPDDQTRVEELPRRYEPGPINAPRTDEQVADRPHVIIADDNADMRHYIVRLLSKRFYVTAVPDGQAALTAAREHMPDLILSDVMMPRLDGYGLLRELRADPALQETPFILLSARAGEDNKLEGVQAGADDYLVKPFSARELTARVEAQIKLHRTRKEANRKQQQLADEYETLLNQAPLGIYVLDSSFRIRQLNPIARSMFDRIPDLIGRDFSEVIRLLVPEKRADLIVNVFRRTLETGESHQMSEDLVVDPESGEAHYYEWRVDRIPLPDGTNGVVCYFRDITQIVQARAAIAASDERLKFAAKAAQLGFWFCDLPFDKLQWDKTVKEHFWLPEDAEARIDTFYERLHPDDREPTRRAMEVSIATDTPYDVEYRTVAADGRQRWVRAMGRAFYDSAKRPRRFDGVTIDITARKRAEEAYRSLAESLEAEVRVRTSELEKRNLEVLAQSKLVREFSQRLLQTQDAERRRIARELHDSAGQTLTLLGIQEAMIAERLQEELPDLHKKMEEVQNLTLQLNQEIRTASYLLHPPMLDETGVAGALRWYLDGFNARSGIDMHLDVDPDLERFPEDIEMALFRIVQEALTNIHRHSAAKSGLIRIGHNDKQIHLEIQDNGKGISAEKLLEIRSGGAGVGFRGMRERVHQLHGNFNVDSAASGTRIFVVLPRPAAESADPPDASQELSANAD